MADDDHHRAPADCSRLCSAAAVPWRIRPRPPNRTTSNPSINAARPAPQLVTERRGGLADRDASPRYRSTPPRARQRPELGQAGNSRPHPGLGCAGGQCEGGGVSGETTAADGGASGQPGGQQRRQRRHHGGPRGRRRAHRADPRRQRGEPVTCLRVSGGHHPRHPNRTYVRSARGTVAYQPTNVSRHPWPWPLPQRCARGGSAGCASRTPTPRHHLPQPAPNRHLREPPRAPARRKPAAPCQAASTGTGRARPDRGRRVEPRSRLTVTMLLYTWTPST